MYWEGRAVALALAASRPLSPLLEGPSGFIASDAPGNEDGGAVEGAACTGGLLRPVVDAPNSRVAGQATCLGTGKYKQVSKQASDQKQVSE